MANNRKASLCDLLSNSPLSGWRREGDALYMERDGLRIEFTKTGSVEFQRTEGGVLMGSGEGAEIMNFAYNQQYAHIHLRVLDGTVEVESYHDRVEEPRYVSSSEGSGTAVPLLVSTYEGILKSLEQYIATVTAQEKERIKASGRAKLDALLR